MDPTIVGWSNPLGVASADHRIVSGTLGLELVPSQPGRLVIDATVLDGSVLPRAGYTQGVVNDAEKSRGVGVRLRASDPGQRVSLEAGFARSRFDDPEDPTLAQGEALVPVATVVRNARYLQLGVDVLRNAAISRTLQANLAATWRYKSGSIPSIEASPRRAAPICSRTRSASPGRWAASRSRRLMAARTTTWRHFRRC